MSRRDWTGRVFIGLSLDGFIARPDGDIDWLVKPAPGPAHASIRSSREAIGWETFFPGVDHLVMGRGTYEKVLTFDPWPYEGKEVTVMSTGLETDDDRITVVRSLAEATRRLAESGAREVYVDGGKAIQSFLAADLVDEITVGVAPILLGSGLPLFGFLDSDVRLALVATHASEGMVHTTYRVYRGA